MTATLEHEEPTRYYPNTYGLDLPQMEQVDSGIFKTPLSDDVEVWRIAATCPIKFVDTLNEFVEHNLGRVRSYVFDDKTADVLSLAVSLGMVASYVLTEASPYFGQDNELHSLWLDSYHGKLTAEQFKHLTKAITFATQTAPSVGLDNLLGIYIELDITTPHK